jgi:serine/threonine protein kinase
MSNNRYSIPSAYDFIDTLAEGEKDFCESLVDDKFIIEGDIGRGTYGVAWKGKYDITKTSAPSFVKDPSIPIAVKYQNLKVNYYRGPEIAHNYIDIKDDQHSPDYQNRYAKFKDRSQILNYRVDPLTNFIQHEEKLINTGLYLGPGIFVEDYRNRESSKEMCFRTYPNARLFTGVGSELVIQKYINELSMVNQTERNFSSAILPLYTFSFCGFEDTPTSNLGSGFYSAMPLADRGTFDRFLNGLFERSLFRGDDNIVKQDFYNYEFCMLSIIHSLALIQNIYHIQHNDLKTNNIVLFSKDAYSKLIGIPLEGKNIVLKFKESNGETGVFEIESKNVTIIPALIDWGLSGMYHPQQQVFNEWRLSANDSYAPRNYHPAADLLMLLNSIFKRYYNKTEEEGRNILASPIVGHLVRYLYNREDAGTEKILDVLSASRRREHYHDTSKLEQFQNKSPLGFLEYYRNKVKKYQPTTGDSIVFGDISDVYNKYVPYIPPKETKNISFINFLKQSK